MRSLGCAVVALGVALAAAVAFAGGPYTPGTVKYKFSGILTLFDAPDAGCKAGVQQLASQGIVYKFVSVKEGSDRYMTCVLRDTDNQLFEQTDIITKKMICADGSESVSMDNSGTWASQGCPCDPVMGCPAKAPPSGQAAEAATGSGSSAPPPPPPPPANTCPVTNNPVCGEKNAPPGPERSKRCTQKSASAKPVSKAAVKKQSDLNKQTTAKNRALVKRYANARREIEDSLVARKEDKTGLATRRKEVFPQFGREDLCPGHNDVNIGMLCGTYEGDFAAANNLAGLGGTPKGCTWHHHEDLGRMQLVKQTAHNPALGGPPHTGGAAIWRQVFGFKKYPACCPAP